MTSMHDEVDRATLSLSAHLTIDAHRVGEGEQGSLALSTQLIIDAHRATPGQFGVAAGCQSCTPTACRHLDWAIRTANELAGAGRPGDAR